MPNLFFKIVLFVIPGYLFVVVGCLATAVDKAFVGHISSLQLAAIGPASSVYEMWTQSIRAINGAQLALLGNPPDGVSKDAIRSTGMVLMTTAGLIGGIAANAMARPGIHAFGANEDMMPYALSYLQVRASFMVMGRIRDSCNVCCLAEKDSVTPFVASLIAFIANVLGDFFLCPGRGAFGAALATDVASCVAAGFTARCLHQRGLWPRKLRCPRRSEARHFAKYVSSLFLNAAALLIIIISETLLASKMGTDAGAAHQICDSIWKIWGLSLSLPMEWAGQTFLSKGLASLEWKRRAATLFLVSTCFSVIAAGLSSYVLKHHVTLFTEDPFVESQVISSSSSVALCSGLIVLSQSLMSYLISLGKVHFIPITGGMLVVLFTLSSSVLYSLQMLSLHRMWAVKAALLAFAIAWQMAVIFFSWRQRERDS